MKRCPKCGITKPLVDCFSKNKNRKDGHQGWCMVCRQAYHSLPSVKAATLSRKRQQRADNPERTKAQTRRNYERHKAAILTGNLKWAKANPAKRRAIANRYYHNNKHKTAAYRKAYVAQNRARIAKLQLQRRRNNPDLLASYNATRRARQLKAPGSYTADDVNAIGIVQKWKCVVCRVNIQKKYHIDHITALSRGGSNFKENLQLLCPKCNCEKRDRDPIEFMQSRGFLF